VFDLTVAVSEAAANAIEHPIAPVEPVITIHAAVDADAVTVTVRDTTNASGSASFSWTIGPGGGGTGPCHVTYTRSDEWAGGFVASVTVGNTGTAAMSGWTVTFAFPGDQHITNAWNATVNQSGANVTGTNASYNAAIAPGGSVQFGFQGTWTSNDTSPSSFSVNGSACT